MQIEFRHTPNLKDEKQGLTPIIIAVNLVK